MTVIVRVEVVEDGISEGIFHINGREEKYPHVEVVEEMEVIRYPIPTTGIIDYRVGRRRVSIRAWEGAPNVGWNNLKI